MEGTRTQHSGQRDGEQHRREGEEDVGDTHENGVDPSAEEACGEAYSEADESRHDKDDDDDPQRDASTEDHTGVDVAAHDVCAEPVSAAGRLQYRLGVDDGTSVLRKGGDPGGEDAGDHDDSGQRKADVKQRESCGHGPAGPKRRPTTTRLSLEVGGRRGLEFGGCHMGHERTRGSMTACTRSTTRLSRTYMTATISVTPRIAGTSSVWIDLTA